MKQILPSTLFRGLLTCMFMACFAVTSFAQGTCATAVTLTPGTPQDGDTADSGDAYDDNTCLGSYDGGNDYLFTFTPTAAEDGFVMSLNLTSPGTWTGISIQSACPDVATTADCVASSTSSGGNESITLVQLVVGTEYFIHISTFPDPETVSFTLTSTFEAPPELADLLHPSGGEEVTLTAGVDFEEGATYADMGDVLANYSDGDDDPAGTGTLILCPADVTTAISITFSEFNVEDCCDEYFVDGEELQEELTDGDITMIQGAFGECLTLEFTPDGSVNRTGWLGTIGIVTNPECTDDTEGPVTPVCQDIVIDVMEGETVTITPSQVFADANALVNVLSAFDAEAANILPLVPDAFEFTNGVTGTSIGDGGGDMYDDGNVLNTDLGTSIPYSDGAVSNDAGVGANGRYFTRKQPGLFFFGADLDGATEFSISGNLGADGNGSVNGTTLSYTDAGGVSYTGFVKRVFGTGDASVNHLIIVPDGAAATQTIPATSANDDHDITGLVASPQRVYFLLFATEDAGGDGTEVSDADVQAIMNYLIDNVINNDEEEFTITDNCAFDGDIVLSQTDFTSDDADDDDDDDDNNGNPVTVTVTDINGNATTCNITVTVNTGLILNCSAGIEVFLDAAGSATIDAQDLDDGSLGASTFTASQTVFGCDDIDVVDVTLTVSSEGGTSMDCVVPVTVTDLIAPVLTCPGDVADVMVNGSFESGDFTSWTVVNNPDPFVAWAVGTISTTGQDLFTAASPTDGGFLASNGFDGEAGEASLSQEVTVPDNGMLSWDENIDYDLLNFATATMTRIHMVEVQDLAGNTLETLHEIMAMPGDVDEDNVWLSYSADLSAYAGQTVQIVFKQTITEDFGGPAKFVVDNVVLLGALSIVLDANGEFDVNSIAGFLAEDACGITTTTLDPTILTCENIGENTIVFSATDVNGQTSSIDCNFVVEFEQPNLACIGEINITLSDDCGATLIPEQLLVGDIVCLDAFDFDITVMDGDTSNGPVIDGCGTYNYVIRSVGTGIFELDFETCWGVVNAEDKTPPAIVSTPDTQNLLCVDFESGDNNVSTLADNIDRCYEVFSNDDSATASNQTGAVAGTTVSGTMAPALRARLLANGTTPVVPTFTDGCSERIEVCVNDVVTYGEREGCDDILITRTFTATEVAICPSASGETNESVVTSYELIFMRPSLDDLDADNIEPTVSYPQCGVLNPTRADYPAPLAGDFPFLDVDGRIFNLTAGEAVCNIGVSFSDGAAIQTCDFTYKFVRTYTVIDWCVPSDIRTFTQVVKVGDENAPTLSGPNVPRNAAGDLVYGTNLGNVCAAYIRLDDITVVDDCSGTNVTVSAKIFPGGDLTATPIGSFSVTPGGTAEVTTAIPAGRHLLRYTYTDVCGNTGQTDYFIVVEDQTPPVAICEDGLNISISGGANGGFVVLTADNLDAGSYDDCSAITRSIARVGADDLPIGGEGAYGPQIRLECADLGTVRVGLRVEDALGNVNYCWLDVLVEDKLRPSCVAPGPLTINCDDYNTTLPADIMEASDETLDNLFGAAAGVDNCGTTITQSVSGSVNSCGVGQLIRVFVSTDDAGFTNTGNCQQVIEVIGVHDYRLTFPVDVSGECATIPAYDGVVADEFACDLITTTVDVDTLRTQLAGDECFKLRLTYDVVNWCEYNSLGEPYLISRDADGALNRSRDPRELEGDPIYLNVIPRVTAGANAGNDDLAFLTLVGDRSYNAGGTQNDQLLGDNGSGDQDDDDTYGTNVYDSRGFFRYTQFIKIYDEVAPVITLDEPADCFVGDDAACQAEVLLTFTALDECSAADVTVELDPFYNAADGFIADAAVAAALGVTVTTDDAGNFVVTATGVPAGNHAIRVSASDGCGNFDVQILEFCVVADRTPTPICIQTLTVVLADDGAGGGVAEIWASDFIASPINDCEGNLVTKYSLYRADDAEATLENAEFNPPATNGINDIDCDDFANGTVRVRVFGFDDLGSTPNFCEVVIEVQDNAGFCGGSDGDLSGLIATDNDEVLEGVSVTLTGAMDMTVTTDVNGNFRFTGLEQGGDYTVQPVFTAAPNMRHIKTSDLTYMIGNILGTLDFDSAYDYVAADVTRDRDLNIFDVVATSQLILGIETEFAAGNWVFVDGREVIDMDNPYAAAFPEVYNVNDLAGNLSGVDFVAVELGNPFHEAGRSIGYLNVEDVRFEAGQTHTIVLDGSALAGFQGTVALAAGLELIAADYVGEGGLNLNRAGEGLIAATLREAATLTLEVRATTAGQLSELLSLTDDITIREGVSLNGASNGLDLAFTTLTAPATAQNVLHQNTPNPVADVTSIRFELATAGAATLTVQDVAGRVILTRELDGIAGLNMVELDNIKATGVLTYTLTSGNFVATRKMVVVR